MHLPFPLKDVTIRRVKKTKRVSNPVVNSPSMQMSAKEFLLCVKDVGSFYAGGGNLVEYAPNKEASENFVAAFLNGYMYGAILHQRGHLALHASSFKLNNKGVLLCGEPGAGKSSLTVAFCQNEATFLTDDITPLALEGTEVVAYARCDRVKLWDNAMLELGINEEPRYHMDFREDKYYYPISPAPGLKHKVHIIFAIQADSSPDVQIRRLSGTDAFKAVRNQIYFWRYLVAMPEIEAAYFHILTTIVKKVEVYQVVRPREMPIAETKRQLMKVIIK